jgi:hypothetical protein
LKRANPVRDGGCTQGKDDLTSLETCVSKGFSAKEISKDELVRASDNVKVESEIEMLSAQRNNAIYEIDSVNAISKLRFCMTVSFLPLFPPDLHDCNPIRGNIILKFELCTTFAESAKLNRFD